METTSLMILNDDCLEIILQNFELKDLINIRGVCPRLDAVIDRFRIKYIHFNVKEHQFITKDNIMKVLHFLGPTMKSLNTEVLFGMNRTALLVYIGMYCTSLEKLVLRGFGGYMNPLSSYKIFQLMTPNLKSLTIDVTIISSDFDADIFDNAPNLEEFVLGKGDHHDIMKLFKKNLNLKSLSFTGFNSLKPKFVRQALKHNLTLEKLILASNHCCSLNNTLVKFISKNLTNLTELAFVAYESFKLLPFGDLPKLKKLTIEIQDFSSDFDSFLEKLAEKNIIEELHIYPNEFGILIYEMNFEIFGKMVNLKKFTLKNYDIISIADFEHLKNLKKLESLSICWAQSFPKDGLLELVSNNQNLKYLDARHVSIDFNFLKALIDVLKKSVDRPKMEFRGFYEEDFGAFDPEDEENLKKILEGNSNLINLKLDKF